jgi:hypothetical protein
LIQGNHKLDFFRGVIPLTGRGVNEATPLDLSAFSLAAFYGHWDLLLPAIFPAPAVFTATTVDSDHIRR